MKNKIWLLFIITSLLCSPVINAQLPAGMTVTKIWDSAGHNAFTDLIRFNGKLYCSFREGSGHIPGTDGVVRILSSADGKNWQQAALLEKKGIDLRDPKLSITPSGQLMVIIGGSVYEGGKIKGRIPQVSFSDKSGEHFSSPQKVMIDTSMVSWGDWIWRVTWYNGTGYAIDYQVGPEERKGPTALYLVKTSDGIHFTSVSKMQVDGFPNESTIRFDKKGKMYVMIRRELEDKLGVIGTADFPYHDWQYTKMNLRLGGPNFLFDSGYGQTNILATSRVYEPKEHTGLLTGAKIPGTFKEILVLPSGGDNSYAGMVLDAKYLWLSYYSSHEGKTGIYCAKIPLSYIREKQKENAL